MTHTFKRRKALSLPIDAVGRAIETDGPSTAVDVSPRDCEVWFDKESGTSSPGKLCFKYDGQVGEFTRRGWTSYVARTYLAESDPSDEEKDRRRHQVATSGGILNLLRGTSVGTANEVLFDWHRKAADEKWRLIVRDKTKEVRLVATPSYELYHNERFWQDVNDVTLLTDFRVQRCLVDEDLFSVRVVQRVELEGYRNLFFGLDLLNSENGSSSSRGSFLLYDLICTNGMFVDLGSLSVFRKNHRHWDSEKIREELREAIALVPGGREEATKMVKFLHAKDVTKAKATDYLEQYRETYGASKQFAALALDSWETNQPSSLWGVMSSITFVAQEYSLEARVSHERDVGRFARKLMEAA
jgi:Domain of unknown function (DUF932)